MIQIMFPLHASNIYFYTWGTWQQVHEVNYKLFHEKNESFDINAAIILSNDSRVALTC